MKLKDIHSFFIKQGIVEDLRTPNQVRKYLRVKKDNFSKLSATDKKYFDQECLTNPYADSRVLFGDPNKKIKRILVGIDIDVSEVLLADRLTERGESVDLIVSHHPEGLAYAALDEVMDMQGEIIANLGIDSKVAKKLMKNRMNEVSQRLHSSNHYKVVDSAKLMGMPLMSCHTPADNHVATYLQQLMDRKKPKTLQNVIDLLMKEPEYKEAMKDKAGPEIFIGKAKDEAGKVFVDMTGGTSGSKHVYGRLSQLGIRTIIGMHLSPDHYSKVKSEFINVIIAGHIASDSLGLNLLLDKLEKKGTFEIIECSGFRRFKR